MLKAVLDTFSTTVIDQAQRLIKLSFIKNDKIIGKNISAWVCKTEKTK